MDQAAAAMKGLSGMPEIRSRVIMVSTDMLYQLDQSAMNKVRTLTNVSKVFLLWLEGKWSGMDSNHRHELLQSPALPTS